MKRIYLSGKNGKGKYALVDDEDFEYLNQFKWYFNPTRHKSGNGYTQALVNGKYPAMHTVIMKPPKGLEVDHRDGNGLNNQRNNLRVCTHAQNVLSKSVQRNNRHKLKGVTHTKYGRYVAFITYKNKGYYLGVYDTPQQARIAYLAKAIELHPEFVK